MLMLLRALKRSVTNLKRHKIAELFMVVAVILVLPDFAFAADPDRSMISQGLEIFISFFGQMLTVVAYAIGQLIILVIGTIVVPILGYNDFGASPVIGLGWSLVRDVVNMFVIIVILYMAFLTIIGNPKANIQQQLPKLLMAVVLLNFSKTITLLIVDIGQVVMMTFVNAIQDIAIGNFVQLFGVNEFFSLSADAGVNAALNGGYDAGVFTATAYATVALMIMVLVILLILAAAYLYRIIMIWVLVVMSPLAWFMKGAGDLFSAGGGVYQQWWKQLSSVVILGPVLTFFLWLSLAVASEGSLASAAGFDSLRATDFTTGLVTSPLAEQDRFLSTLLAMILLVVGLRASGQFSEGFGEIGERYLNEGFGQKLLKGAVMAPAKGARKTARLGAGAFKAGGNFALKYSNVGEDIGKVLGVDAANTARNALQWLPGGNAIAGTVAGGLASVGAGMTGAGVAAKMAARKKRKERAGKLSQAQKAQELTGMVDAEGKPNYMSPGARQVQYELLGNLATDDKLQDELKAQLENKYRLAGRTDWESHANTQFETMMADSLKYVKANEDDLIEGEGAKKGLLKTRAKYMHHSASNEIEEIMNDENFKLNMIEPEALEDSRVRAIVEKKLGSIVTGYSMRDGQRVANTMLDDLKAGKGVSSGVQKMISGERDAKAIDATAIPTASQADLAKALRFKKNSIAGMTDAHMTAAGSNVVDAIIDSEVRNFSDMQVAARAELLRQVESKRNDTSLSVEMRQKANQAYIQLAPDASASVVGNPAMKAFGLNAGAFAGTRGGLTADQKRDAFGAELQRDVTLLKKRSIGEQITASASNELSREVMKVVDRQSLQKLLNEYQSGLTDASGKADIATTVETIQKAIAAESTKPVGNAAGQLTQKQYNTLKDLARDASLIRRQMT